LGPPARRPGPPRPDPRGRGPGDRDGLGPEPRPRPDRPGAPRPPRRAGPAGRRLRGPARGPGLGQGARARPGRRRPADRDRDLGRRALDRRPPRPAPASDRLPRPRHRPSPRWGGRPGRAVAGHAPLAGPLRPPGRRRRLAMPDAPPIGPGADRPAVGLVLPRRRGPGQGDVPDPGDRGGRRPPAGLDAGLGLGDRARPPGGPQAAPVRPAGAAGPAVSSSGTAGAPAGRWRSPRPRGCRARRPRPGWSSRPLRASRRGGR